MKILLAIDGSRFSEATTKAVARRMRSIALQSAIGGMLLSIVGMLAATMGYLPPIGGAIAQEIIDLGAVLNAVRVALPSEVLTDF